MERWERRYLVLFVLAFLNDALDMLRVIGPLAETLLDLVLAVAISLVAGLNPWLFIVALIDVLPWIDIAPFWTLYVLYLYLKALRRVRVPVE